MKRSYAGVNGERERAWAFASTPVSLVLMASCISVSCTTVAAIPELLKLLNPLLELFNYPITQTCGVIKSNADTVVLDTISGYECMSMIANRLLYQSTPMITTAFIPHDCAREHRHIIAYWYNISDDTYLQHDPSMEVASLIF